MGVSKFEFPCGKCLLGNGEGAGGRGGTFKSYQTKKKKNEVHTRQEQKILHHIFYS